VPIQLYEARMKFEKIGTEIGQLVEQKNAAYGSSFKKSEEILKVLYPNGIQPDQYKDMLAITRILDKLFRIATRKDAFGESPFKDIAGYGILGVSNDESKEE
jgi:ribosome biogenesis protein Nip4